MEEFPVGRITTFLWCRCLVSSNDINIVLPCHSPTNDPSTSLQVLLTLAHLSRKDANKAIVVAAGAVPAMVRYIRTPAAASAIPLQVVFVQAVSNLAENVIANGDMAVTSKVVTRLARLLKSTEDQGLISVTLVALVEVSG